MERIYYNYVLLNPTKPGKFSYGDGCINFDFEPFYVGKGKNNRMNDHMNKFALDHDTNKLKANVIRKIHRHNLEVIRLKLFSDISEDDAFYNETFLITTIGRRNINTGPLCNLTDGGEGSSGRILSDATKDRISKSLISIGMWAGENNPSKTDAHKLIVSSKLKGRIYSADTIKKMKDAKLGKNLSISHKQQISKGMVGHVCSESTKNNISSANTGKIKSSTAKIRCAISKMEDTDAIRYLNDILFIKINIEWSVSDLKDVVYVSDSVIKRIKRGSHWAVNIDEQSIEDFIKNELKS